MKVSLRIFSTANTFYGDILSYKGLERFFKTRILGFSRVRPLTIWAKVWKIHCRELGE
jgi:hypothetical protein